MIGLVALALDTTRQLRTPSERLALVEAIRAARPEDESHWLEWKSTLNIGDAAGRFSIARTLLGFANRTPESARRSCGGCAYFVVGVEPGSCQGVEPVDLAELEQRLAAYLGSPAPPRWSAEYTEFEGKRVLVFTVEPPEPGARMATLGKAFDRFPAGTIFVRGHAKTEAATPAQVFALEDRLLSGVAAVQAMDIVVTPVAEAPGVMVLADFDTDDWIERRYRFLMSRLPPASSGAVVAMKSPLWHISQQSRNEYEAQVEEGSAARIGDT